ncbi:MAG TPA: aminoacyl-tRNA hydrolase [Chloroflexota bacterium]|nr:aminoacyl-tRNA hydrolase [Chloroflexota bacterium]
MVIVGLGNPGREYQRTRHNVGFMSVDALAACWGLSFNRQKNRAEIAEGTAEGYKIILAKPQTFMNNSGEAVRPLLKMNNLTPANLLVIADDLDLPFGRLRLRDKGSSGGQRGIRNIIDQLGTDQFARLRIGIGRPPPGLDPIDYVLQTFSAGQATELKAILDRAVEGVEILLTQGIAPAMNRVNTGPGPAAKVEES